MKWLTPIRTHSGYFGVGRQWQRRDSSHFSAIETRLGVEPSTTRFAGDWHHRFEVCAARRHGRLVTFNYSEKLIA